VNDKRVSTVTKRVSTVTGAVSHQEYTKYQEGENGNHGEFCVHVVEKSSDIQKGILKMDRATFHNTDRSLKR
jgi:hypothetical protein